MVVLTPLIGNGDLSVQCFNNVAFWVQIYNVLLLYMSKEMGELLGSKLETVEKVDMGVLGDCVGRYLRVRVTLDVSFPLKPGLCVQFHSSDPEYVLPVLYEKLPDFCFHCGRLGQIFREYEEYVLAMAEDGSHPPLPFGNWIRASNGGFSNRSEKAPVRRLNLEMVERS